jgi:hypothetical protein
MRHSIATHLLDAGEPIDFVKDHLGHRSSRSWSPRESPIDAGLARSAGSSARWGSDLRFRFARIRPRGLCRPLGRLPFLHQTPTLTAVSEMSRTVRLGLHPRPDRRIKALVAGDHAERRLRRAPASNHTVTNSIIRPVRTTSTPMISTSRFRRRPLRTRRRPRSC